MSNVLVACEESQRVASAFRERGHEAYSCDIQRSSGGHPEWHILGDVLKVLNPYDTDPCGGTETTGILFETMDGAVHFVNKWDLIIAHPPCTFLTVTGNRWFNVERYGDKAIKRLESRRQAVEFFMRFCTANCERICIENPVGYMNTAYRKPDQIIQPYMFGDAFEKKTCLWLKNLPLLAPTNIVKPPPRRAYASGATMPAWYADCWSLPKEERSRIRSQTFPGIANAMADQWSKILED